MTRAEAKQKVIDLARQQLGYHEGSNNYTKYAEDPQITRLYGWNVQHQPWCCTFFNWLYLNAFGYDLGSKLTYGGTAACASSAQLYKSVGAFSQFPDIADQAFFNVNGGINHTGIVISVDGSAFVTIEGNYSDKVSEVRHNIGSGDVAGFGKPNWKLVGKEPATAPAPAIPTESHNWKPNVLKYGTKGIDVYVLQSILVAKKFYTDNNKREIDGEYGAKTQAAVNQAKKFYGMMANGEVDKPLLKRLLEVG